MPCGNRKCMCYKDSDQLKMDCANRNITSVREILNDVPVNTTILDLGGNDISLLENKTFGNCENLKYLHLENNSLAEIEQYAFEGLHNLNFLNLSNNALPFMSHGLVPAIFKPLRELLELDIHINTKAELLNSSYPDDILSDVKSLEMLRMDGIANATFGTGFKELKNLTTLNISGWNAYCKMRTLKNETFRYLSSVKYLDISYCDLSVVEAEAFSPLHKLDFIDMTGNKDLGYLALQSVFFGLRNTTAETLKYSSMFQSRMGTELKVKHLQYFNETRLENIYIDDNALEMCEDRILESFPKTIKYLSLQSNKLMLGPWIIQISTLTNLEVLDFSYQFRSRFDDIPLSLGLFSNTAIQIRSASGMCPDLTSLFPKKLKKIFNIGSKLEYRLPCVILDPDSNQLEEIRASGNIFHSWQGPFKGLANLKILELSKNYCSDISLDFFSGMPKLQELYASTNFIGLVLKKKVELFKHLTNLRILDLSFNVISKLPANVFEQQVHLERLGLSTNGLMDFGIDLQHMNNLTYLDLSGNSLVNLPLKVRNYIEERMNVNSIEVDMSDNPIKCTCENKDFVYWLADHRGGFKGFRNYNCLDENGAKIKFQDFDKTVEDLRNRCISTSSNGTILVISTVSCLALLTIILLCTLYRYRWRLRYLYYMTKSKYRGYSRIHGSDTTDDYRYDAFISYAGEELTFIKQELVKALENERNLKLSVHQRDFMAGNPIAENIVDAISNSRKTVLILTDNFLRSDWCVYEFRMAKMESNYSRDGRDIFVIVMLENVPSDTLPLDLLRLIQAQTYIEYPVNPQDRELFWNQVKDAIMRCE